MNTTKLWIYKTLTCWLPESRFFGLKNCLLRWAGARIGTNVRIYSSVRIVGTGTLEIGDDVHIGSGGFISSIAPAGVKVGNCVDIGPQVMILTGSHEVNTLDAAGDPFRGHMAGRGTKSSVIVGDGCWLGARTVILPGVNFPSKIVTAAGSVVTKTIDSTKVLIAGVPAQIKKRY